MTKMHLHVLDTDTGTWTPATSTGASAAGMGGGSRASADDWTYAAASGGITDTTGVSFRAAQGNGTVNYLTALQVRNADASVATEVVVTDGDGGTVLWRMDLAANSPMLAVHFPQPLRASTNTALYVDCVTTSSETYFNAQGYTARDVEIVEQQYGTDAVEVYDRNENPVADRSGNFVQIVGQ